MIFNDFLYFLGSGSLVGLSCGRKSTVLVVERAGGQKLGEDHFAKVRELVKDLTLHIAAAAPAGLAREDIPADLVESEKDLFRKQMENSGKPPEIIEKIIVGKLGKFYAEKCLLEQGFVKDPDTTIKNLLEAKGKDVGDTLSVRRFVRYALGE